MRGKVRSGTTLTLLLIAMLTLAFNRAYGEARSENVLCVVETTEGGYALAGVTQTFGAGGGDFWFVKTDSAGNMEWSKTYGGVYYGEWILYAGLASSIIVVGAVIAIYVKRIKT